MGGLKETVVTIRIKGLYRFDGWSKGSTGWLNIGHEFFKRNVSTLEPDFYNIFMRRILKVYIWKHIKRV